MGATTPCSKRVLRTHLAAPVLLKRRSSMRATVTPFRDVQTIRLCFVQMDKPPAPGGKSVNREEHWLEGCLAARLYFALARGGAARA